MQYNFGLVYYNCRDVQDYNKAFELFQEAAERGLANAQLCLGIMYAKGEDISQNYDKAFEWYQKAAEQGLTDAQYNLGVMYYNGQGVPQDYNKAFEWFQKAAEQGHEMAKQFSKNLIGRESGDRIGLFSKIWSALRK